MTSDTEFHENRYDFDDWIPDGPPLGAGSFGTVYFVYHRRDPSLVCAMKVLSADARLDEFKLQRSIQDCPNIVQCIDIYRRNQRTYILMEYCRASLLDVLIHTKTLSKVTLIYYFRQIINGLLWLKRKGIVHRDVKLENILFSSGCSRILKIADFGLAVQLTPETRAHVLKSSPQYTAPEIHRGEPCGFEGDCWSLGVVLFALLHLVLPWGKEPLATSLFRMLSDENQSGDAIWPGLGRLYGNDMPHLLRSLLWVDPSRRLTLEEAYGHAALSYPEGLSEERAAQIAQHEMDIRLRSVPLPSLNPEEIRSYMSGCVLPVKNECATYEELPPLVHQPLPMTSLVVYRVSTADLRASLENFLCLRVAKEPGGVHLTRYHTSTLVDPDDEYAKRDGYLFAADIELCDEVTPGTVNEYVVRAAFYLNRASTSDKCILRMFLIDGDGLEFRHRVFKEFRNILDQARFLPGEGE